MFVTQYNSPLSSFVPNFRILTQVVAEKSLTEKKFTDRQTNRQTNIITEKGKNYIPPIYFVPGGITKVRCIVKLVQHVALTIVLKNPDTFSFENSEDPDQMASYEAI